MFKLGIAVLLGEQKALIKGQRVGLITNPTGVDQNLRSVLELLYHDPDVNLTTLFGPEHGVRGSEQAGGYVESYVDGRIGLPVYSLYGSTLKPTPNMLENIDVLLLDIQDVGTRFYTYIYTMAYAMEAAAENNIQFIVLDRPNPISGVKVEGPVLESAYSSFVGKYSIPVRHGMTVGELARLFNREYSIGAKLNVVKMAGWKRSMFYDETQLAFIPPSPNIPTLDTVLVYPGAALLEGTNVSEGRGTTKPFELIGAPFIDGTDLASELTKANLPGVRFRATSFTPMFSKYSGELSHGIHLHVTHRLFFNPVETGIHIVKTIHNMYPKDFEFRRNKLYGSFFDLLVGNGWIRDGIENGKTAREIIAHWKDDLEYFKINRQQYLLYK